MKVFDFDLFEELERCPHLSLPSNRTRSSQACRAITFVVAASFASETYPVK
jgi:hypothetical protein